MIATRRYNQVQSKHIEIVTEYILTFFVVPLTSNFFTFSKLLVDISKENVRSWIKRF